METLNSEDPSQICLMCSKEDFLNCIISFFYGLYSTDINVSTRDDVDNLVEGLSDCLVALDRDLWNSAKNIKNEVNTLTCEFFRSLNEISSSDVAVALDGLFLSLRNIEKITKSVDKKCERTIELRNLEFLGSLLALNQRALGVIYNWDDSVCTIKSFFSLYERLNDSSYNASGSLIFPSSSDDFNLEKLRNLKEILATLKHDNEECLNSVSKYENIAQMLNGFIIQYYCILEQLSTELVSCVFGGSSFKFDPLDSVFGSTERYINLCITCVDLYVFDGNEEECSIRLINDIRKAMLDKIRDFFKNAWDSITDLNSNLLDDRNDEGYLAALGNKSAISSVIQQFFKFISSFLKNTDFIKILFKNLESRQKIHDSDVALNRFIFDIVESSLLNFDIFEDVISKFPDDAFQSVVCEMLSCLQNSLIPIFEDPELSDITRAMVNMSIIPKGIVDRYTNIIYNRVECFEISDILNEEYSHFSHCLNSAHHFLSELIRLEPNLDSFTPRDGADDIGKGFTWLYAIFFVYKIKYNYDTVMEHILQQVSKHFLSIDRCNNPRTINTKDEESYKDFLVSLCNIDRRILTRIEDILSQVFRVVNSGDFMESNVYHSLNINSSCNALNDISDVFKEIILKKSDLNELITTFSAGSYAIDVTSRYISDAIRKTASLYLSEFYSIAIKDDIRDDFLSSVETGASLSVQLVGEYFTCLLPIFCEDSVQNLKILQYAFRSLIDSELENLAETRPKTAKAKLQYCADIRHLMKIANLCSAEAAESLNMLLVACKIEE